MFAKWFKPVGSDLLKFFLSLSLLVITPAPLVAHAAPAASPAPKSQFNARDLVQGLKSPKGGNVYYEGKVDTYGREKVYSFQVDEANKTGYYERGVQEKSGQVRWTVYRGANYPVAQAPQEIIPRNRALVLTGRQLVTGNTTGSGFAEVTSSYTESIKSDPNYNPKKNAALWKPSQLGKTLEWTEVKSKQAKAVIDRLVFRKADQPLTQAETTELNKKVGAIQGLQNAAVQISGSVAIYYIAMGMISAYYLMTSYPNNPMAWDKYLHKLTDPMGWLMLVGFLAAAYPFLSRVSGTQTAMGVVKAIPLYAAGIMAGAMTNGLIYMAANPDVRACTGVFNLPSMERDMAACDRAFDAAAMDQVMMSFVPAVAGVFTAAGIFLGGWALINASGLGGFIRGFAATTAKNGKGGGLVGLVLLVASGLAFLGAYEIANGLLKVEKTVRENMIADWGLSDNPYGKSINDIENNLFTTWEKVKANGWNDFERFDPEKSLPACTPNASRVPAKPCGPPQIDFEGTLARYHGQLELWRTVQFMPAYSAYDQWQKKVERFHGLVGMTYDTYKDFVYRIAYEIKNPNLSKSDARGFNPLIIANIAKSNTNGSVYKGQTVTGEWERRMGLNKDITVLANPITNEDFSGHWKYVDTRGFFDFMVTSMACGPEAEGLREQGNFLSPVGDLLAMASGNTSPSNMIDQPSGMEVNFMPPRLVKRIAGTNGTACEEVSFKNSMDFMMRTDYTKPENLLIGGQLLFAKLPQYRGLYDYIKANVRENIIAPNGEVLFDKWWEQNVIPQIMNVEKQLRADFEKMLRGPYTQAMLDPAYHWATESQQKNVGFFQYLPDLMINQDGRPSASATHRLAHGVIQNYEDELRLYLAMLLEAYVARIPGFDKAQGIARAQEALRAYADIFREMTVVEPKSRRDVVALQANLINAINGFLALDPGTEVFPMVPLQNQITTILNSVNTYYGIVSSFEPKAPPQEPVAEATPAPAPPSEEFPEDEIFFDDESFNDWVNQQGPQGEMLSAPMMEYQSQLPGADAYGGGLTEKDVAKDSLGPNAGQ